MNPILARTYSYIVLLFAFILPISPLMSHWVGLAATIVWIFLAEKRWRNLWTTAALLPISWWLWQLVMLYNELPASQTHLILKISFVLFPLLFFTSPNNLIDLLKNIQAFIFGTFFAAIYCLITAFGRFNTTGVVKEFFYEQLTSGLDFHPTYLGWYSSFALFATAYWALYKCKNRKEQIWTSILTVFWVVFIVLLSARIVIIGDIVIVSSWLLYTMHQKGKIGWAFGGIFVILSLSIGLISQVPALNERFIKIASLPTNASSADARSVLWRAAIPTIQKNPLLGIGQAKASALFEELQTSSGYPLNNAHNQWLQTQLVFGIIGTVLLAALLIFLVLNAFKNNQNPFFTFCTVIFVFAFFIFGMTEALLERERGVLFFIFFYCLFFIPHSANFLKPNTALTT